MCKTNRCPFSSVYQTLSGKVKWHSQSICSITDRNESVMFMGFKVVDFAILFFYINGCTNATILLDVKFEMYNYIHVFKGCVSITFSIILSCCALFLYLCFSYLNPENIVEN